MHVAAQLFQQTLQAVNIVSSVPRLPRSGAREVVESGCVAIFGPPRIGCLVQSALNPRALRLAILRLVPFPALLRNLSPRTE